MPLGREATVNQSLIVRLATVAVGAVLFITLAGLSAEPTPDSGPAAIVNNSRLDWAGMQSTHTSISNTKSGSAQRVV